MAQFTNQATLTYTGGVASSNVTTGELITDLSVTKSALQNGYTPGGRVCYAISLVNSGSSAYNGLTITDDLGCPGGTDCPLALCQDSLIYYVQGVLQPTPTVTQGPPLAISGISVPAGCNAMVVYETAVTDYAPLSAGSCITNTCTVSGAGLTDLTAQATVDLKEEPILTIEKSMSPQSVSAGDTVTYTFLICNSGCAAAEAAAQVVVSDQLDPALTGLTAALNGTPMTLTTDYTYTGGLFETVAGVITVPAATASQTKDGTWTAVPGTATLTVTGTI